MRRRHHAWITAAALALAAPASAQQGGDIDLQSFRPAMDSRGYITLDAAQVLGHLDTSFGLVTNWGTGLLRFQDGERTYQVEHMISPTLVGALGLGLGGLALELGASVPFSIMAGDRGPDARDDDGLNVNFRFGGQGLGDVGLHLKWRLLRPAGSGLGLALSGAVFLPTASERGRWLGNDSAVLQGMIIAGVERARLRLGVNAGLRVRTAGAARFTDAMPMMVNGRPRPVTGGHIEVGATVPAGVALAYALVPQRFELVTEVFGAVPLGGSGYFPLEAVGGIKVYLAESSFLSLGGGAGLLPGRGGNPGLRAYLGIVFEPRAGDRDGDGVPDDMDACVVTPEDRDDFEDQDGCPDLDMDGDGVEDEDDECPAEAEDADGFEDADGCPDLDNDQDLVRDEDDACPGLDGEPLEDVQETHNGRDDHDGCPDGRSLIDTETDTVVLRDIHFEFDSAVIKEESHDILETIARSLSVHTDIALVEVQGHTDERGAAAYNLDLSERRARAVVAFLVAAGVDASRLRARGYGESMPVSPGHGEEVWARNRRVELVILERAGEP